MFLCEYAYVHEVCNLLARLLLLIVKDWTCEKEIICLRQEEISCVLPPDVVANSIIQGKISLDECLAVVVKCEWCELVPWLIMPVNLLKCLLPPFSRLIVGGLWVMTARSWLLSVLRLHGLWLHFETENQLNVISCSRYRSAWAWIKVSSDFRDHRMINGFNLMRLEVLWHLSCIALDSKKKSGREDVVWVP